ncbi:MAG: bifunctional precorrin-2 dehydrogenase/sirohydrochlorin ferrochelatase [Methanospirillaceae archaeon]|nr:bifunctional precorrin-2 dehydrogenase/sirohydrochlorin ferrochelatase [Methanospirillaceae archaeon]
MIPLMIDCTNRQIVIFGGGQVGARKASYFIPMADVTVYSRTFCDSFDTLAVQKEYVTVTDLTREDLIGIITGAFLVITATSDPDLNSDITALCRSLEVLVNNADKEEGDVFLPSRIHGDDYCIAISTCGSSPAVSRFVRYHLEDYIRTSLPYLDPMIHLQKRLRTRLKETITDQVKRKQIIWQVLCDTEVQEMLCVDEGAAWHMVSGRYLHEA